MPTDAASQPSAAARLVGLIVDPQTAFRGIGENPSWALAFFVALALRFGSLFAFYRPAVTPLKVVTGLLFQITTIIPVLLVASLVVWLAARAWGVRVAWKPSLAVGAHAYVAYTLSTIAFASVAGALLPESTDVDLRSPPFTNLAALAGDSIGEVTRRLIAEVDVRSLYSLALIWFGLRGAAPAETRQAVARVVATIAVVRLAGVLGAALVR